MKEDNKIVAFKKTQRSVTADNSKKVYTFNIKAQLQEKEGKTKVQFEFLYDTRELSLQEARNVIYQIASKAKKNSDNSKIMEGRVPANIEITYYSNPQKQEEYEYICNPITNDFVLYILLSRIISNFNC